ncbi:MAG: hypothetical protein GF355_08360 [Candidatus Eisenbacteria bacterium]|nr:hypothetical protein [Candidatus Eisenbacteria bacterium]
MNENQRKGELEHDHHPEAIYHRLRGQRAQSRVADAVLGAMDGSITTFTIVAGAVGGGLSGSVVVILGLAKVAADALSMAVSNFLSRRSEAQEVERMRAMERRHVEQDPAGEREEIRQIFHGKGFRDDTLEEIVRVLAANPDAWIETMIKEEHDLPSRPPHPLRAGLATFFAFLLVGAIPLAPFVLDTGGPRNAFAASAAITGIAFVLIGVMRGRILDRSSWRSGLETLLTGAAAAGVAYGVGAWLRHAYGVA